MTQAHQAPPTPCPGREATPKKEEFDMDIAIVGRHTKVNDDLRQRIAEKMEKVEALAPRALRAEVHVVHERNPKLSGESERVEITVRGQQRVVRAEASAVDRVAALDAAAARLVEQLRKLHERKAHRHQGKVGLHAVEPTVTAPIPDGAVAPVDDSSEAPTSVEEWEGAPAGATREVPIDGTPIVIRSKTHAGTPMTVSEAIDQMELVGHDFYLFLDSESGHPSAVYRRRGWTYGVIHLDPEAPADAARESA